MKYENIVLNRKFKLCMNVMILHILKEKTKTLCVCVCVCIYICKHRNICIYGTKGVKWGKKWHGGRGDFKKNNIFYSIDSSCVLTFHDHVCIFFHELNYRCSGRRKNRRKRKWRQCRRLAIHLDGHALRVCAWLSGRDYSTSCLVCVAHCVYRYFVFRQHSKLSCPPIFPALRIIKAFQDQFLTRHNLHPTRWL